MAKKQTIVIVGSGYAGIETFNQLEHKCIPNTQIVLISKTNFFYHCIASPRTLVDESYISDIVMPLDKLMMGENKTFIHGEVTKINSNDIKYTPLDKNATNDEETLAFDYLILALGTKYPFNIFNATNKYMDDQLNEMKEMNQKFKTAKNVLVVGGGPVGVETAGELATDRPDMKVTLITNGDRLISYLSPTFSQKSLRVLQEKNVEVIFNDTIDLKNIENFKTQKIKTTKGKELEFDAYLICYGGKPCTDVIKTSFPEWLNETGQIKVNKNLQVLDKTNIFAIGDCCDTAELKMALNSGYHTSVVANNISLLINNNDRLKQYAPFFFYIMFMSIGRDNGAFQVGYFTGTGFVPAKLKSSHLLISKYKKELKLV